MCQNKSRLNSDNPVVCILAIQSKKEDYKRNYEIFKEKIGELEDAFYQNVREQKENFNDKIHRFQFGFLNVQKNPKVASKLIDKSPVRNPKFIIVVSSVNLVRVFNNLGFLIRRLVKYHRRHHFRRVWGLQIDQRIFWFEFVSRFTYQWKHINAQFRNVHNQTFLLVRFGFVWYHFLLIKKQNSKSKKSIIHFRACSDLLTSCWDLYQEN